MVDLDELERLVNATTPGPWLIGVRGVYGIEHNEGSSCFFAHLQAELWPRSALVNDPRDLPDGRCIHCKHGDVLGTFEEERTLKDKSVVLLTWHRHFEPCADSSFIYNFTGATVLQNDGDDSSENIENDVFFVIRARTAVPLLIARIRELEQRLSEASRAS